jgi:regulator of replication initiation timing
MATDETASPDAGRADIFETVDKLATRIRSLEDWYAVDFRRRLTELTQVLHGEIVDSLRAEFNAGFQQKIENVRTEYKERLQAHLNQWHSENSLLQREIGELKKQVSNESVLDEIVRVEQALQKCTAQIEMSISDDSVVLGKLLQIRTQELELKAYLKGLNFRLTPGKSPEDSGL